MTLTLLPPDTSLGGRVTSPGKGATELVADILDRARLEFRGENIDQLVAFVAKEIQRGRIGDDCPFDVDERDIRSAERALALIADVVAKRAHDTFNHYQAEMRAVLERSESNARALSRIEWTRRQLLYAELPPRGRKTMLVGDVRRILDATSDEVEEMGAQLQSVAGGTECGLVSDFQPAVR